MVDGATHGTLSVARHGFTGTGNKCTALSLACLPVFVFVTGDVAMLRLLWRQPVACQSSAKEY